MADKSARAKNNKVVRTKNKRKILSLIHIRKQASIDMLVSASSLSYPTVFGIVKELTLQGVLEKQGYAPTTGGRQASYYSICANYYYTIGIHIYVKWISLTISTIKGGIVYEMQNTGDFHAVSDDDLVQKVSLMIDSAITATRIDKDKFIALKICSADQSPACLHISAYRGLSSSVDMHHITTEIERTTGIRTNHVSEKVVLNFMERTNYVYSKLESFIHIVFEHGLELSVYRKSSDHADITELNGCFGHTTIIPDGAPCSCGCSGCIETYCNGRGLYGYYQSLIQDQNITIDSFEEMAEIGVFYTILHRCRMQDPFALQAMDYMLSLLGISIANLIKTLGIGTIVLSGFFTSSDSVLKDNLEQYIRDNFPKNCLQDVQVIIGMVSLEDCSYGACLIENDEHLKNFDFID